MHLRLLLLLSLCLVPPALAAEPEAPPTEAPPAEQPVVVVELDSGLVLEGPIVREDRSYVVILHRTGERLRVSRRSIVRVRRGTLPEMAFPEVRESQRAFALVNPTAQPLKAGQWVLAQRALFLTHAALGITDHVTVDVGGVLPFIPEAGLLPRLTLGGKVGTAWGERVHVAAGVRLRAFSDANGRSALEEGALYGAVMVGGQRAYVSGTAGATLHREGDAQFVGATLGLSGGLELLPHLAVVTDNTLSLLGLTTSFVARVHLHGFWLDAGVLGNAGMGGRGVMPALSLGYASP